MKSHTLGSENFPKTTKRLSKSSDTIIRILKRSDFISISSKLRARAKGLHLQAVKRTYEDFPDMSNLIRVGFTCSRKVGNSVKRNMAKRRLRNVARECLPMVGRNGWDYIIIGRYKETGEMDYTDLKISLINAIHHIHTLKEGR
jgi:ribonuclease P protein component